MENINQIPNLQSVQPVQSVKTAKTPNIFKYLFFVSIIVLLGVIIGFYFILNNKITKLSKINNSIQTVIPTTVPTLTVKIDSNQVLTDLQKTLKVSSPIQESYSDWLVPNNQKMPISGPSFQLATKKTNYVDKYGDYSSIESITENSFKPLQSIVDSFFQSNGFKKDDLNTYRKVFDETIPSIYLRNSYTKENLKCSLILYTYTDPYGSISCGTIDENQTAWKRELVSIVNPEEGKGFSVRVKKLIGNYANGTAGSEFGGGYFWIAAKVDNQWKIVFKGQDAMPCSLVEEYQIPKEIYEGCL